MQFPRFFRSTPALLIAVACLGAATWAQADSPTVTASTADFIVALVNSEPITNSELEVTIRRVSEQMKSQGQPLPAPAQLRQSVLERLISDKAQLQFANEYGIRIEDAAVDLAEQNLARQSQISLEELHKQAAKEGLSVDSLRTQLREQLTLNRLRERDVDGRVKITDQDIDRAIAEQLAANSDPFTQDINLAQLLIATPEHVDAAQLAQLQEQAQQLLQRARAGEDFAALVKQYSSSDRLSGGEMGLRRADRYPPPFVRATQNVAVGAFADVLRSPAGFHILKVLSRQMPKQLVRSVVQSRARHILLRLSPQLSQEAALAKLADFRQRILQGKADFQSLAREYSQDGSAAQGGDLGWASPGMFVPEFEEVMTHLNEGEISLPMVSRFGVHLIQLVDRRKVDLSPRDVRELVRNKLRESKLEEAYTAWAKDIRERAFVEFREPPAKP
jgi:peptidyl-prolyl cis-trans isomerase SurA